MPKQALLKIFKRCRIHSELNPNGKWKDDVHVTRGIYVLYEKIGKYFNVKYIGIGGTGSEQKSGIFARLKNHAKNKSGWTHYSIFEVHDNITSQEIRELESLFLTMFRNDKNVKLLNKQKGGIIFEKLSHPSMWPELKSNNKKRKNS